MTMRAALYSRYSSDQQRAASIENQFRVCREHAEREGWKIGGCYRDAAISGNSVILRPGVQALLEDARRGVFDVVVAEALDRVSRDQVDVAVLYKHLRFAGVTIVTLAEGEISELHVGVKGTMNALFLKDLAAKTHPRVVFLISACAKRSKFVSYQQVVVGFGLRRLVPGE